MTNLSYDIAVIGGGPSGIAAAYSAAKLGSKVILIEKEGCLGGMSTVGALNTWCGSSGSAFWRSLREKTDRSRMNRLIFNPEELKSVYPAELKSVGCNILLYTTVIDVECDNGHISSVTLYGKGEKTKLNAEVFIDSTGDGELAYMAGVPYQKGRKSDGLMQPLTLLFFIENIDETRAVYPTFGTHPYLEEAMADYIRAGKITPPLGHVILIEGAEPGTACVNMTNIIKVDGTDVDALTRADLHARSQIPEIVAFLREAVPGYENCRLSYSANSIGIRESRRFVGDYTFTEQDILASRIFKDWIVTEAAFSFDNHNLTGSGADKSNLAYHGEHYTLPARSFFANGFDNLLLNGRCISGSQMAHSSYRVMPICFAMGEGVGTLASHAVRENVPLREVDISEVQSDLVNILGVLPPKNK